MEGLLGGERVYLVARATGSRESIQADASVDGVSGLPTFIVERNGAARATVTLWARNSIGHGVWDDD